VATLPVRTPQWGGNVSTLATEKAPTYNDSQQTDSHDIPRASKQTCQTQIPQAADTMSVPTHTTPSEAGSL